MFAAQRFPGGDHAETVKVDNYDTGTSTSPLYWPFASIDGAVYEGTLVCRVGALNIAKVFVPHAVLYSGAKLYEGQLEVIAHWRGGSSSLRQQRGRRPPPRHDGVRDVHLW